MILLNDGPIQGDPRSGAEEFAENEVAGSRLGGHRLSLHSPVDSRGNTHSDLSAGIEDFDNNKGGIVLVWIHIGGIYY